MEELKTNWFWILLTILNLTAAALMTFAYLKGICP